MIGYNIRPGFPRDLCSHGLRNSRDGDHTIPLGSLLHGLSVPMVKVCLYTLSEPPFFQLTPVVHILNFVLWLKVSMCLLSIQINTVKSCFYKSQTSFHEFVHNWVFSVSCLWLMKSWNINGSCLYKMNCY